MDLKESILWNRNRNDGDYQRRGSKRSRRIVWNTAILYWNLLQYLGSQRSGRKRVEVYLRWEHPYTAKKWKPLCLCRYVSTAQKWSVRNWNMAKGKTATGCALFKKPWGKSQFLLWNACSCGCLQSYTTKLKECAHDHVFQRRYFI